MLLYLLLGLTLQSPCEGCGEGESNASIAVSQFDGLQRAVVDLQHQVELLARERDLSWWTSETLDSDLEKAVVVLSDTMADNSLLTRAYLALAVGELQLLQNPEGIKRIPPNLYFKMLRHVEAIQLAIDDRSLEGPDFRVYKVLTAGVRQELRNESSRIASLKPVLPYSVEPNCVIHPVAQMPIHQYHGQCGASRVIPCRKFILLSRCRQVVR